MANDRREDHASDPTFRGVCPQHDAILQAIHTEIQLEASQLEKALRDRFYSDLATKRESDAIRRDFDHDIADMQRTAGDRESRIRALERNMWKGMGVALVIWAVAQFAAGWVITHAVDKCMSPPSSPSAIHGSALAGEKGK